MRRRQWEIDQATAEIVVRHRSGDSQIYSLMQADAWLGASVTSVQVTASAGLSAAVSTDGIVVNVKITGGAGSVDVRIENGVEGKRRDVRFRVDPVEAA